MIIDPEKHYLISTEEWFFDSTGRLRKGVWGKGKLLTIEEAFEFRARAPYNWMILLEGLDKNHEPVKLILPGCQVNYIVECDKCPVEDEKNFIWLLGDK